MRVEHTGMKSHPKLQVSNLQMSNYAPCSNLRLNIYDFLNISVCAVAEGEVIIRDALAQCDNPHHTTVRCTAGAMLEIYLFRFFN